jgi:hypothetical protein
MPRAIEPIDQYAEALTWLENAATEIDQAHATLKDLCLDWYGPRGLSIRKVSDDVERILKALKEMECDECGKPIKENCLCWRPGWVPPSETPVAEPDADLQRAACICDSESSPTKTCICSGWTRK